ncbi:hypothetical protein E8L03_07425 [Oceanidesulfovibrio marinus]|uniref:RNA methyltransferase n=1 Tax=Oceanidesulfovibrio marinus TaxID=370038 RepID=A0ABX6NEN6_9BACT|nr:hypothetical protein E8L03_07425 [Oceanidesulfovibrio marinus]
MATYRQIQDWVRQNYGQGVKTCWVAHVKEMHGLAPVNSNRTHPCPTGRVSQIEAAFRHFGMI